jgi:hypothetical protein
MSERGMDYAQRPTDEEVFDYQREYVKKVADGDILETLRIQREIAVPWIQAIPASEADAVHEPYGWSIWQVIQHCVDAERVFGYRALRFATGDQTELPGWDGKQSCIVAAFEPRCLERNRLCRWKAGLRSGTLLVDGWTLDPSREDTQETTQSGSEWIATTRGVRCWAVGAGVLPATNWCGDRATVCQQFNVLAEIDSLANRGRMMGRFIVLGVGKHWRRSIKLRGR